VTACHPSLGGILATTPLSSSHFVNRRTLYYSSLSTVRRRSIESSLFSTLSAGHAPQQLQLLVLPLASLLWASPASLRIPLGDAPLIRTHKQGRYLSPTSTPRSVIIAGETDIHLFGKRLTTAAQPSAADCDPRTGVVTF